MPRERSPNYPSLALDEAVDLAKLLYDAERRTAVPPAVAVKAFGYKSLSGPARSKLAALRHYGLVDWGKDAVKVSDRALTLFLRQPGSPEYRAALQEAALDPEIFTQLYQTHLQASDEALRHHLVMQRNFTEDGANRLIETFRKTVAVAGLEEASYDGRKDQDQHKIYRSDSARPKGDTVVYSWPLSRTITAEVRLSGGNITARHLEQLREYLRLAEKALESDDSPSGEPEPGDPIET